MDIQYITDIWACIAYLTSYICKPERTMSELMKKAIKESSHQGVREKLSHVAHIMRKAREVSRLYPFPYHIQAANYVTYKPPTMSKVTYTAVLIEQLQHLAKDGTRTILVGDFNMDFDSPHVQHIKDACNFEQHITSPTHQLGGTLDLMFTSLPPNTVHRKGVFPAPYTDHFLTYLMISV